MELYRRDLLVSTGGLAALSAVAPAAASPEERDMVPEGYTLSGSGIYPEGLAFDPRTQTLFTTSMLQGTVFRTVQGVPATMAPNAQAPTFVNDVAFM